MAKELKVDKLKYPANATVLYDDWYLDIVRILRKKIFVFMHIQTRVALAIPNYEIGSIQGLFECFPLLFREFLNQLDYGKIADEAFDFFSCHKAEINFVKTDDKSTF